MKSNNAYNTYKKREGEMRVIKHQQYLTIMLLEGNLKGFVNKI